MTTPGCSQPGCQVAASGKCLEGFEPIEKCPYLSGSAGAENVLDAGGSALDFIDLPSGEALSEADAAAVTREGNTKVVVIAGPFASGKTTILSSVYETFLTAPMGSYLFRGSRTLVGFERRSHLGREESGRMEADTSRTSIKEGTVFLHLNLATEDRELRKQYHLLLSDISGELFAKLRDSADAIRDLPSLRRADHFCLVIDGAKIVHPERRHAARNDSRSILRSIIEAKVLPRDCAIEVAFTKWDLVFSVLQSEKKDELTKFLSDTRTALEAVSGVGRQINFYEVAARPQNRAVPFAHGVPTLLRSWLHEPDIAKPSRVYVQSSASAPREMSRFTKAVLASQQLEGKYDIHQL